MIDLAFIAGMVFGAVIFGFLKEWYKDNTEKTQKIIVTFDDGISEVIKKLEKEGEE